jgi:hypothetical protein
MKLRVLTLCVIAALAACHRQSGSAPSAHAAPQVRKPVASQSGPTAQELTADMVEAATLGKSQAPVMLKFDLLQRPVQGQPLELAIALLPQVPASPAIISVTGSDGLQLGADDRQIEFPSVDAQQVYRHSLKLTPTAEGVLLLTLNVSLKHEQLADTRVFSVPIIVAANGESASSPGGAGSSSGSAAAAAGPAVPAGSASGAPGAGAPQRAAQPVADRPETADAR